MYKRLILRIFLNQYYSSITTQKLSTKKNITTNHNHLIHSIKSSLPTINNLIHSIKSSLQTVSSSFSFSYKSSLPTINNIIHFTQNIAVNTSSPHPFHTQNKNNPPQSKNSIKNQTTDNNKYYSLVFNIPILQIQNSTRFLLLEIC